MYFYFLEWQIHALLRLQRLHTEILYPQNRKIILKIQKR